MVLAERRVKRLVLSLYWAPLSVSHDAAWAVNLLFFRLPSKANDIELQEITENAARSTDNLIKQLNGESSEDLPMRELLSMDKQLRSIRGLLKVQTPKKVESQQGIDREKCNLIEIRDNLEYDNGIREDIQKRIKRYNDDLKVRQESIDLLKGRLTNQITSFKETIAKVLDKDTSLAKKMRTLFREQGITIASNLSEWLSVFWLKRCFPVVVGLMVQQLVQLVSLRLRTKRFQRMDQKQTQSLSEFTREIGYEVAKALPGIIGVILSRILNKATDVVGCVSQNLWGLVVGVRGLLYT